MVFIRREREKIELNEQTLIDIIYRNKSDFYSSYGLLVPNCYTTHDNEADLFAIRRNGLCDEFEVKISRSDFLNDFKKIVNYRDALPATKTQASESHLWGVATFGIPRKEQNKLIAPWQKLKHDALREGDMVTNYFWYVVVEGVATASDVPDGFGLAVVNEYGRLRIEKRAERLHTNKIDTKTELKIVKKLAYRFWDYRMGRRT